MCPDQPPATPAGDTPLPLSIPKASETFNAHCKLKRVTVMHVGTVQMRCIFSGTHSCMTKMSCMLRCVTKKGMHVCTYSMHDKNGTRF